MADLDFLLASLLPADHQPISPHTADQLAAALEQPAAAAAEQTQAEANRSFNRIHALLLAKENSRNALGARLARLALHNQPHCLPSQGPRWLQAIQNILPRHNAPDHPCLDQLVLLLSNILESAPRWPDFAREHCHPKAITTLARSLLGLAADTHPPAIRARGLRTLAGLVARHASLLRPLASQLHAAALATVLSPEPAVGPAGASLLTQLYRLSGKTDAAASWAKTITATIGTLDPLLAALLSPFVAHQPRDPPLAPLEIPLQDLLGSASPLPLHRIPLLLARAQALVNVLLAMLAQPSDRPVRVPLAHLVALASSLLLLRNAPPHDRADQAWKLAWEALGGTVALRVMACRLVARLSEWYTLSPPPSTSTAQPADMHPNSVRLRMTPFTSQILTILAGEIEAARERRTGEVTVMCYTYARVVQSSPCNPETVQRTLAPLVEVLLADIQAIYGARPPSASSEGAPQPKKARRKASCAPAWTAAPVGRPAGAARRRPRPHTLSPPVLYPTPKRNLNPRWRCEALEILLAATLAGLLPRLLTTTDPTIAALARHGLVALAALARPRVPPVFPAAHHDQALLDVEPVDDSDEDIRAPSPPPRPAPPPPQTAPIAAPPIRLAPPSQALPAPPIAEQHLIAAEETVVPPTAAKRKSDHDLPRPLKKPAAVEPVAPAIEPAAAAVEPDSSDDEDGNPRMPALVFDDDDDEGGEDPVGEAEAQAP
ncbi:hypothetical protein PTTG_28132 [Puccinia triticina 1-1 BBBD Race 1]|uniref:Pre-rRNA-processing protein RIX1 n=1 Tax=Puccinia triticina (isolate 1-1 / race 1 (BBBD)) TaxID=630390 RepID=A0A180GET0_PUCT1|nr:hypothetical protein PTTG_28132 [Puccinia triticina 1-1 BBBD Race 1]